MYKLIFAFIAVYITVVSYYATSSSPNSTPIDDSDETPLGYEVIAPRYNPDNP